MKTGQLIRRHRESLGLTQAQLHDQAGLAGTRISISRYECNTHAPNIYTLRRIARVVGVTVDELIGDEP